ncbi:alpha/beta fold hydrolase [Neobacillus niacini]|uniref:alpha/beta fold hydrolase n=1 Tax=Neobacillus niacini TaxID=86668 RepID=UPI0021CB386F|nr:alpha/beta hydrolase [Neobacillus niacini]MCM3768301.1 alpha/beta hydrolase [Neobacillus niacini]
MILPQLENFNAFEEVPKLKIPIYFCEGKYDYDTAFPLVEQYYKILDSPKKQFFLFNKSAHWPQLDEQKKFSDVLLTIQKDTLK